MEQSKKRDQLRRRIDAAARNGQGHRKYDSKLKRDVKRYVERRMGRGASLKAAAREISLSPDTLWAWMRGGNQRASDAAGARKTIRRVNVVTRRTAKRADAPSPATAASAGEGIVVVMPNGVRIEGLGGNEVASIVRGLL